MTFFALWYLFPITMALGYLAANTQSKWASMLCAILIFFVPPFAPPTIHSVYAITLTQLIDSVSLGMIVFGFARSRTTAGSVSPTTTDAKSPEDQHQRSNNSCKDAVLRIFSQNSFVLAIPFAIAGPILVYLFTCELSLLLLVPALFSYPIIQIVAKKRGRIWGTLYLTLASFIASTTAFNEPALDAYLGPSSSRSERAKFAAFLLLFLITLLSGIANLFFAAIRFSSLLPLSALFFGVGGTISGRLVARFAPLGIDSKNVEKLYLIVLAALGVIGLIYLSYIVVNCGSHIV